MWENRARVTYEKALKEISAGEKRSHWIWYIWPSMSAIRKTMYPQLCFTSLEQIRQYSRHSVLQERLCCISEVATKLIEKGRAPNLLFGGNGDDLKFHETMTCFYIVATDNPRLQRVCADALIALKRGKHQGVVDVLEQWIKDEKTKTEQISGADEVGEQRQ